MMGSSRYTNGIYPPPVFSLSLKDRHSKSFNPRLESHGFLGTSEQKGFSLGSILVEIKSNSNGLQPKSDGLSCRDQMYKTSVQSAFD